MSQGGPLSSTGSGGASIETLTGNSGGAVGPDASFNINVVGNNTTGIDVVGNPGLNTLTIVADAATTTQRGTTTLATNAETIAGANTTKIVTPDDLSAKLGVQTIHGVAIGGGSTAALSWTSAGTAGEVLTSNGAALDPTFQALPASTASISPYIVGTTGVSDFATISAAITQAVADGASNTNQKNIYVKPGTYTENPPMSDGINLIAWPAGAVINNPGFTPFISATKDVILVGTVILGSSQVCSISGFQITPAAGLNAFEFTAATSTLKLYGNTIVTSGAGVCFNVTSTAIRINSFNNSITSASSAIVVSSTGALVVHADGDMWKESASSTNAGSLTFRAIYSTLQFSIDASSANATALNFYLDWCFLSGGSLIANFGANVVSGQIEFKYSQITAGAASIINAATNASFNFVRCQGLSSASSLVTNTGTYTIEKDACSGNYFAGAATVRSAFGVSKLTKTLSGNNKNFIGSDYVSASASLHTTNATTSTIGAILLNATESITVTGQVIGAQDDHTNAVGGNFLITARRQAAGNITLIGAPVVNVNSSSTATFTVDVDIATQTVRIRVTGVAATNYNWVTTFNFQKVLTDA